MATIGRQKSGNALGKAWIAPPEVTVGRCDPYAMMYEAGEHGIATGGGLRVTVFGREALPKVPVEAKASNGSALRVREDTKMMLKGITVEVKGTALKPGDTISIRMGETEAGEGRPTVPPGARTIAFHIEVDVDSSREFVALGQPVYLKVAAGAPHKLVVTAPSNTISGHLFALTVKAMDRFGNPVQSYEGRIELAGDTETIPPVQYQFRPEDKGAHTFWGGLSLKTEEVHRIRAEDLSGGLLGRSNPIDNRAEEPDFNVFWGDIHGQSFLSDGLESPDFYYTWARDVERLDFCALTDHADNMRNRKEWKLPESPFWTSPSAAWSIVKYVADVYNRPGKFVTLVSYEWTSGDHMFTKGRAGFGDKNVYYPTDDGPLLDSSHDETDHPRKLWRMLREQEAITIPHHPAYPRNPDDDRGPKFGTDWRFHDEKQVLVEIYSKHGTSEFEGNPRPLVTNEEGGFVQDALARGYRLGIIAGSDTHMSRPGSEIIEPTSILPYRSGLTAVYATALTRKDIYEALKHRRCYGTTGERILLAFYVNGHMMGEELTLESKDTPRTVSVKVAGTSKIEQIDIVKNNEDIYAHRGQREVESFEFVDGVPVEQGDYYYIRVTQEDGERAWSSPVWVDLK